MVEAIEYRRGTSTKKSLRTDEKLLVSRREVAARLSISQRTIDYLIANETLNDEAHWNTCVDPNSGSLTIPTRRLPRAPGKLNP
jgi:hypothetical protein